MTRTTRQIIEDLQHLTRYGGYGISDELSRDIQDLIAKQATELKELKQVVDEYILSESFATWSEWHLTSNWNQNDLEFYHQQLRKKLKEMIRIVPE